MCGLLIGAPALNAMDLEIQSPKPNNMLAQLKKAIKNKNINQVQELLHSAPRNTVDNFSSWFKSSFHWNRYEHKFIKNKKQLISEFIKNRRSKLLASSLI